MKTKEHIVFTFRTTDDSKKRIKDRLNRIKAYTKKPHQYNIESALNSYLEMIKRIN